MLVILRLINNQVLFSKLLMNWDFALITRKKFLKLISNIIFVVRVTLKLNVQSDARSKQ